MKKNEIIVDGKVIDESAFQSACDRYVQANIVCCISSLMCDIGRNLEASSDIFNFDYDESCGWFSRPDYETAADNFVENADLDDLETIAEQHGYWSDVIDETRLQFGFDGESEEEEFEEWVETEPVKDSIRERVYKLVTDQEAYEWVCNEFSLDYDYDDVYEHWAVDRWFAQELQSRGHLVFEFSNFLVWGRQTTGQSISLDGVVRDIVKNMDEHAYVWGDN